MTHGAQRASGTGPRRALFTTLVAIGAAVAFAAAPRAANAASMKVVIVVGPVGSKTADYIDNAKQLAAQAKSYGATVYQLYSPNATWSRVRTVAQGANVFIYLGHGNGWPSPYAPYQPYTKDGLGLNATSGNGNSNVKYYGEYYVGRDIRFAPDAVVIFNRLCYASGNSEWGSANPTRSVAKQRIDNYAAGFLRARARAVFAEAIGSASYILYGVFKTKHSMNFIFKSHPIGTSGDMFTFASTRTAGKTVIADPKSAGLYYRSFVGDPMMYATQVRS